MSGESDYVASNVWAHRSVNEFPVCISAENYLRVGNAMVSCNQWDVKIVFCVPLLF